MQRNRIHLNSNTVEAIEGPCRLRALMKFTNFMSTFGPCQFFSIIVSQQIQTVHSNGYITIGISFHFISQTQSNKHDLLLAEKKERRNKEMGINFILRKEKRHENGEKNANKSKIPTHINSWQRKEKAFSVRELQTLFEV